MYKITSKTRLSNFEINHSRIQLDPGRGGAGEKKLKVPGQGLC